MNKYRRIEVNAFRRRVTVVSGEWPSAAGIAPPLPEDDFVSLNGADACHAVEPASPEGQEILLEAVRSLERRLSPEARDTIRSDRTVMLPVEQSRKGFDRLLHCLNQIFIPRNKIPL